MTSFSQAAVTSAVVLLFLWTSALGPCRCENRTTDCDITESYHEVVTVSVNEPVHIIKYTWCLDFPPRCPDNRQEYRTVHKNITVPKTRRIRVCCKDQIQLYDDCIPKCTKEQCPNIKCVPGTTRCKCKSGFVGQLCQQRCDVGSWGPECKKRCDTACSDCDHRTGCCMTPAGDDHTALVMCDADHPRTPAADDRLNMSVAGTGTERENGGRDSSTTPGNVTAGTGGRPLWLGSTTTARTPTTPTPMTPARTTTSAPTTQTTSAPTTQTTSAPTTQTTQTTTVPKRLRTDGMIGMFYGKVDVLIYDQLVKKLIWISAMTVVAIAMVFIIMFVVFINCYGAYKPENAARNRRRPTSLGLDKIDETCIITQNPGYVSPDRYSKTPTLHTSNNGYTTFHPEIFCPVFSAPHHTGGSSLLYDTPRPQPVYEMLS